MPSTSSPTDGEKFTVVCGYAKCAELPGSREMLLQCTNQLCNPDGVWMHLPCFAKHHCTPDCWLHTNSAQRALGTTTFPNTISEYQAALLAMEGALVFDA